MAHSAQRAFFETTRRMFPASFRDRVVLDCGSLDVNGSLAEFFIDSVYVGVDVRHGPNVTLAARLHEIPFLPRSFDVVVSAEMLEHDEHWKQSLGQMYRVLRDGGLMALSMATTGRAEHGTRQHPDTGESVPDGIWGTSPDYYRNVTADDLAEVFELDAQFQLWAIEINPEHHDLYFWGLKA